jgi:CRP-like cAMP-binding protein
MQKEALLAFFRNLVDLSPADAQHICARFSPLRFPVRAYLIPPHLICQQVFFVTQGVVRVSIQNPAGEDISCFFATEGQFVSNYDSFITGKPSPYSLQALEACEVLAIDRQGLQELYQGTQYGERIGRLMAEHLFTDATERLTSFYIDTPEQRYQQFLLQYPGLSLRIPQHYIAAYIGVRPQSLSRIKRRSLMARSR